MPENCSSDRIPMALSCSEHQRRRRRPPPPPLHGAKKLLSSVAPASVIVISDRDDELRVPAFYQVGYSLHKGAAP